MTSQQQRIALERAALAEARKEIRQQIALNNAEMERDQLAQNKRDKEVQNDR